MAFLRPKTPDPWAPAPRPVFAAPGYVRGLAIFAILSLLGGGLAIFTGEVLFGFAVLLQAIGLVILHALAEDVARTRWRLDQLDAELRVVINEAAAAAADRETAATQRERALREQREALARKIEAEEKE